MWKRNNFINSFSKDNQYAMIYLRICSEINCFLCHPYTKNRKENLYVKKKSSIEYDGRTLRNSI